MAILLYHGSTLAVRQPNHSHGRSDVDFGQGFYLTTLFTQAERWARRRALLARGSSAVVSTYVLEASPELLVQEFAGYSEEWLDFVIVNRISKGNPVQCDYDVVIGNVADDDVVNAIDRYLELGRRRRTTPLAKQALLEELSFAKPNNQYCLKTERAISCLIWQESVTTDG